MSYSHAQVIMENGKASPVPQLRAALSRLKVWTDLNPALTNLYVEFQIATKAVEALIDSQSKEESE